MSLDFDKAEYHLNRCHQLQGGASEATQLEFQLLRVQMGDVDDVQESLLAHVNKKHAETPLILSTVARSYMHHLRYGPAYHCLSRWIEEYPDDAKPYHWRGWVLERMNKAKAALEDYKLALERQPDLFPVRLRLAEMYLEDSNPLLASPHLKILLEEHPDRAAVKARYGQCLFLQGKHEESRRWLEEAVSEMPDDPPLLLHLAKLDLLQHRLKESEKKLRHILTIDQAETEAWYNLMVCLRQQGRRSEADAALAMYEKQKAVLDQANKLLQEEARSPTSSPEAAAKVGATLLELGQERLGLFWLNEALTRDPGYQPAHRALADFYGKKGDSERAMHHRRQAGLHP